MNNKYYYAYSYPIRSHEGAKSKPIPPRNLDSDIKQLKMIANRYNGARSTGIQQEARISTSQHSLLQASTQTIRLQQG